MKDAKEPKNGDVIASRFLLKEILGRGAFAEVWLANDLLQNSDCVLKLYSKEAPSDPVNQLWGHLRAIHSELLPLDLPGINLSYAIGEIEGFIFEAYPHLESFRSLDQVITDAGALHPRDALAILSHLASAVNDLHNHDVIHADLKPANILVSDKPDREVRIIDFGMVQPIEGGDEVIVFSTYSYMHPLLATSTGEFATDIATRHEARAEQAGPYIDIYAIGIIALELLTASRKRPDQILQTPIVTRLRECNPWLQLEDQSQTMSIANLVYQFLTVRPGHDRDLLSTLGTVSESLARQFPEDAPRLDVVRSGAVAEPAPYTAFPVLKSAAYKMSYVGNLIAAETGAFLLRSGTVESIEDPKQETRLLADVNSVFLNALSRTRTSWRLGVAMTVVSFAVLVGMIVCAITLTMATGEARWAVIFGSASVGTVIGTLMWKPYDRLFEATIVTQQIEMIHIQTITAFRGSRRFDERLRVCRDAVEALRTLYETTKQKQRA